MNIKKSMIAIGAAAILMTSTAVFSEPGSESDPLVTLSYVNKSIEQVKKYVDERFSLMGTGAGSNSRELEVVELSKGQFLIAHGGTEIILRGGKATAIASDLGGLTDVTEGVDLAHDTPIPSNHLLIIPRNDGRGAYCTTDAFFMVRGGYEIR